MSKNRTSRPYAVGYGKPPVQSRFKPGQSGNPRGRPRGTRNLKTDLVEELSETLMVTENGRPRRISKQRAMVKALTARALKGDTRAAGLLVEMIAKTMGLDPTTEAPDRLPEHDEAILEEALARFRSAITDEAPDG